MPIAEARVETNRPSRYLIQLCRHINVRAQAHSDVQARVEWSDDTGLASFGWGQCTLRADPGVLKLRVEAVDDERLQRIKQIITQRLERFGRRDHLTVSWTQP